MTSRVPLQARILTTAIVALGLLLGNLFAQNEGPPVFKAESEVVRIDLIVTDKQGKFVPDLQAREIEVWEDGRKQKITFFHQLGPDAIDAGQSDQEPLRPQGAPGAEPPPGAYFVVLLDLESLSFDSLLRTKRSLEKFFQSQLSPEDRVMLVSIKRGLRIHQSFTNNLDKLREKLDQISIRPQDSISILSFIADVEESFAGIGGNTFGMGGNDELENAIDQALQRATVLLVDLETRLRYVCHVISALSRHLGSLEGRKNVLFFSEGYPLAPGQTLARIIGQSAGRASGDPMSSIQVTQMVDSRLGSNQMGIKKLQSAMSQANRFQVSFYSVDSRGLLAPPINAEHAFSGGYPDLAGQDINAPQEFLTALASGTGGLSFLNNNDLGAGLHQVYSDSRQYYVIGYTPNRKKKARKTHRIKVKLRRKNVTLRYRRGYSNTNEDQLASAFRFPELFQDFPFQARVTDKGGALTIRMFVPTSELSLQSHETGSLFVVEMFGALLNKSGKWVANKPLFKRRMEHNFPSDFVTKILQSDTIDFTAQGKAPPGNYKLVVVLHQGISGKIGTFVSDITVQK